MNLNKLILITLTFLFVSNSYGDMGGSTSTLQERLESLASDSANVGASYDIQDISSIQSHKDYGLVVKDSRGNKYLISKDLENYSSSLNGASIDDLINDCRKYAIIAMTFPEKYALSVGVGSSATVGSSTAVGNLPSCALLKR